jgi:uncharacterized protein YdeI (BOF family)
MTIENDSNDRRDPSVKPTPSPDRRRHWVAFPAIAIALAVGVAGGAGAMKLVRPTAEMAPMTPVAISSMPTSSLVTIKGKVAEIYGNKFILQDDSGKALIETGPAGDGANLVTKDEAITVQGRFDNGFVHASYLVDENGKTEALHPPGPPPHGELGDFAHRHMP